MKNTNKIKSGIPQLGEIPWGSHICHFYKNDDDIFKISIPFIAAGLKDNERCIWVIPNQVYQKRILKELAKYIPDVKRFLIDGQLTIVRTRDWYLKGKIFDGSSIVKRWLESEKESLARGYAGLRATGIIGLLPKRHWPNLMSYEASVCSLLRKHRITALCSYSADVLDSAELVTCTSNHDTILMTADRGLLTVGNTRAAKARIKKVNGVQNSPSARDEPPIETITSKNTNVMSSVLTSSEAASMLSVHINTLRRWSNSGLINEYRLGSRGDRRFKREDIAALLKKNAG